MSEVDHNQDGREPWTHPQDRRQVFESKSLLQQQVEFYAVLIQIELEVEELGKQMSIMLEELRELTLSR